jgi:aminoglycoside N3'-acetyltransferase
MAHRNSAVLLHGVTTYKNDTNFHRRENLKGCIQKFPDGPPGARTANVTAVWIVSLFCESV